MMKLIIDNKEYYLIETSNPRFVEYAVEPLPIAHHKSTITFWGIEQMGETRGEHTVNAYEYKSVVIGDKFYTINRIL